MRSGVSSSTSRARDGPEAEDENALLVQQTRVRPNRLHRPRAAFALHIERDWKLPRQTQDHRQKMLRARLVVDGGAIRQNDAAFLGVSAEIIAVVWCISRC